MPAPVQQPPAPPPAGELEALYDELTELREEMTELERQLEPGLAEIPGPQRESAVNLVHYLALRRRDIRRLQARLTAAGFSSLGRAEARVAASVDAVRGLVAGLLGERWEARPKAPVEPASTALERHTAALLGPRPATRRVRIMVTLPSEAADDPELCASLVHHGMDVARINCAHDDALTWERMIRNVHAAPRPGGRPCLVMMDLAGPKLRTGPIEPGPRVLKWSPTRDALGRVVRPVRLRLTPPGWAGRASASETLLPVSDGRWLAALGPGDRVTVTDLRSRGRDMTVLERTEDGCVLAETTKSAYVTMGSRLHARSSATDAAVGQVEPLEQAILLNRGDTLILRRDDLPGRPARDGEPASIGCLIPEVLLDVRVGERLWFDDGKIGGVAREVADRGLAVEITHAPSQGEPPAKLRADKGINLPDTALRLTALTEKDRADLRFVARHADVVALSFVQRVSDVDELRAALGALTSDPPGLVLKIETERAFRRLPELLLAAMRSPRTGVMIARGDLAVEVGYERMAEVQEEMLWLCEAAHMPVIWATQVLETLAKTGRPSRAEVTDAAMGERAECVMLNKGPFVGDAVRTLDNILRRMEAHQFKKSPLLRPLRVAGAPEARPTA
ncbi:MAG: pyruvate kinase [Planctomycetota bacterium]|nr:pyruvate kinase [Planctomycetota bacterium]